MDDSASGTAQHISTATNAQDIASFLSAYANTPEGKKVKNPQQLNYWGFSYSTFIGMTFANMFPSRVGRVVLDGVVDPIDYVSGQGFDNVNMADIVINTIFDYCFTAGPGNGTNECSYFTGNSSADIQKRFNAFIKQLNPHQAFAKNWSNATTSNTHLKRSNQYLPVRRITRFHHSLYLRINWVHLNLSWKIAHLRV